MCIYPFPTTLLCIMAGHQVITRLTFTSQSHLKSVHVCRRNPGYLERHPTPPKRKKKKEKTPHVLSSFHPSETMFSVYAFWAKTVLFQNKKCEFGNSSAPPETH